MSKAWLRRQEQRKKLGGEEEEKKKSATHEIQMNNLSSLGEDLVMEPTQMKMMMTKKMKTAKKKKMYWIYQSQE